MSSAAVSSLRSTEARQYTYNKTSEMSNNTTRSAQSGSYQSIPAFDYEHLQPMDGVVYTTLKLPPIIGFEARISPRPLANSSQVPTPVSAPINRPVQESQVPVPRLPAQTPASPLPWPPEEAVKLFNLRQSAMTWEGIYSHFPGQDHGEIKRQYEICCLEKKRDAAGERRARDDAMIAELRRQGFDKVTWTDY